MALGLELPPVQPRRVLGPVPPHRTACEAHCSLAGWCLHVRRASSPWGGLGPSQTGRSWDCHCTFKGPRVR